MKVVTENLSLRYKIWDFIFGVTALMLVILAVVLIEKKETEFWLIFTFFSLFAVVLLRQFFNPIKWFAKKNHVQVKLISENSNRSKITRALENEDLEFELIFDDKLSKANWSEIQRIIAYKTDLYTVNHTRLFVEIDKNRSFDIGESTKGWFVFINKMKVQFPEISKSWQFDMELPPFARNETELFNKNKKTESSY